MVRVGVVPRLSRVGRVWVISLFGFTLRVVMYTGLLRQKQLAAASLAEQQLNPKLATKS